MVEDIILRYSKRGMDLLAKHLPQNFCEIAANAILALPRGKIALITGFSVNSHPETDGPVGTYFLAKALKSLGFSPFVVTDCASDLFFDIPVSQDTIDTLAVIAIERCGRTCDGTYRNMRGVDISDKTEPLDELLSSDIPTFAFGDGGNEAGMGSLAPYIDWLSPCVVKSDYTVVSTVSNWGCYGVLKYLGCLPTTNEVYDYFCKINALGAVDGITGLCAVSADGFDFDTESEILYDLSRA